MQSCGSPAGYGLSFIRRKRCSFFRVSAQLTKQSAGWCQPPPASSGGRICAGHRAQAILTIWSLLTGKKREHRRPKNISTKLKSVCSGKETVRSHRDGLSSHSIKPCDFWGSNKCLWEGEIQGNQGPLGSEETV